jgi:molybdate transport system substrate-binding protein
MRRQPIGTAGLALVVAAVAALVWAKMRAPAMPAAGVEGKPVRVAAAADLRFALEEIASAYARTRGTVPPQITYGSSGTLYSQIQNGAPFDLFLSADRGYPRRLAESDKAEPGTLVTYASGRLALWVRPDSPLEIERDGLSALADPRVAHVSIANPAHAPYGRAAEAAMRAAGVYQAVEPKLVLGENVSQALQFVEGGSADAGLVALALARAPKAAGRYVIVPERLYPPLEQSGVVLRTDRRAGARDFERYLQSDAARAVLTRYGFAVPGR